MADKRIDLSQLEVLEALVFQIVELLGGPDIPEDVMLPAGEEVHDLAVALRVGADALDIAADMLKSGAITAAGVNAMKQKFAEFQVAMARFGDLENDAE